MFTFIVYSNAVEMFRFLQINIGNKLTLFLRCCGSSSSLSNSNKKGGHQGGNIFMRWYSDDTCQNDKQSLVIIQQNIIKILPQKIDCCCKLQHNYVNKLTMIWWNKVASNSICNTGLNLSLSTLKLNFICWWCCLPYMLSLL